MAYERHGSGRPVLFLHGWCLNSRLWMYEDALVGESLDVILADLPGLGASDGMAGPYTIDSHAAAISALLTELDLREAVIVGFAYGAAVALEASLAQPARISGLVLAGVPRSGQLPDERMLASMQRDWPRYARRSAQALCKKPQSEATIGWLEDMFLSVRVRVARELWSSISGFDPLLLCPEVQAATLFLHGEHDDFTSVTVAREAAASMRRARVAVAPGSGHLVVIDDPSWFHRQLVTFLSEL
jgi:non-heme chloroperoxidase